jgi:hypothetical protein
LSDDFQESMRYIDARSAWINREIPRRWVKAHIVLVVCGIITVGMMLVFREWIILVIMVPPAVLLFVCGYQTVPKRLEREYDGRHHEEPEYHSYLRMVKKD